MGRFPVNVVNVSNLKRESKDKQGRGVGLTPRPCSNFDSCLYLVLKTSGTTGHLPSPCL